MKQRQNKAAGFLLALSGTWLLAGCGGPSKQEEAIQSLQGEVAALQNDYDVLREHVNEEIKARQIQMEGNLRIHEERITALEKVQRGGQNEESDDLALAARWSKELGEALSLEAASRVPIRDALAEYFSNTRARKSRLNDEIVADFKGRKEFTWEALLTEKEKRARLVTQELFDQFLKKIRPGLSEEQATLAREFFLTKWPELREQKTKP